MDTKPKSNSVITTKVDGDIITFVVKDSGELMLDLTKLSAANRSRGLVHGMIQRISDRAAIPRNTETGQSATPADKLAAMRSLVEFYETGTEEWAPARIGGGGPSAELSLLIQALVEAYPAKSQEELATWAGKRSKSERAALMLEPRLKPIVERLREAQGASVDAASLLEGLGE